MILEAFQKGIVETGSTFEAYHLSKKQHWESSKKAFSENENIVFALPVFAAILPGIMLEFLEELVSEQEIKSSKKISFILQSGFPEACQRRYCEDYLKILPEMLKSTFSGILSYGINVRFIKNTELREVLNTYQYMGTQFVKNNGTFFFKEATEFTGDEYISETQAKKFNQMFNFFCRHIVLLPSVFKKTSQPKGWIAKIRHLEIDKTHDLGIDYVSCVHIFVGIAFCGVASLAVNNL